MSVAASARALLRRTACAAGLVSVTGLLLTAPAVADDSDLDDHGLDRLPPSQRQEVPPTVTAREVAPQNTYQLPFPCRQEWYGSTRSSHSPSAWSIDFNRTDDVDDPIVAPAPGVVTEVSTDLSTGYGRMILVEHANGEATRYAHLNRIDVALGQRVDQGRQLGLVGESGRVTGPHLHFEQWVGGSVVRPWFNGKAFSYPSTLRSRNCVDVPLAGSFAGKGQLALWRRGATSTFRVRAANGSVTAVPMGSSTDEPVLGDWNGDGITDLGLRQIGTGRFVLKTPARTRRMIFGSAADQPIAGDWDGDGRFEVGVRKSGSNTFALRNRDGSSSTIRFGGPKMLPVTGDWDGDGVTDLGVYNSGTAVFRLREADGSVTRVQLGEPGSLPIAGDWNRDGVTELGTWNPATAEFLRRHSASPTSRARKIVRIVWGRTR